MPLLATSRRPIRVALARTDGVRDPSLLAVLRRAGCVPVRDVERSDVDVILVQEGDTAGTEEAMRRLREWPAVPVILVMRDGRLEIYDRTVVRRAAADDLVAVIQQLSLAGARRNPQEGPTHA